MSSRFRRVASTRSFESFVLVFAAACAVCTLAVPAGALAEPNETATKRIVDRARLEVERKVVYDPAWVQLGYPNGDPSPDRGVCTDVVVRSYRAAGIDFQKRIHEDILERPKAYATVKHVDASIDHRRVAPMLAYLRGHATSLPQTFETPTAWKAGDIVVWGFRPCPRCSPDHVGVVSDRVGPRGLPLVIHNIGPAPSEDDQLDAWTVLGHFRLTK